MKATIAKFWKSIKRNPVIMGFIFALLTQLAHDYLANEIDWTNILGYLGTLCVGVFVREFTVSLSTHRDVVSKLLTEGLENDRNTH